MPSLSLRPNGGLNQSRAFQILQVKETANPFSLAVFNEYLYWTDAKRRVILSAHKISGKNSRVLLKQLRQPFGVKVSDWTDVHLSSSHVWTNAGLGGLDGVSVHYQLVYP